MSYPNPSTAFASVVTDELVRNGVSVFVAAPGSRSAALVLAAASHPGVELVMAIDERSAAFHALGRAKAGGSPAAVVTTSGTAVANLAPAVVEADMAGTPLVILSADRPHELRKVGANQAIDQADLFGGSVRLSLDLGPPETRPEAPAFWRSSISQVTAFCRGYSGRPGPVHLNLAFREPTVAVTDDGRSREEPFPYPGSGRPGDRPWTDSVVGGHPSPGVVDHLAGMMNGSRRGLILAGSGVDGDDAVRSLGEHLGWPVLATGESGLRGRRGVVSTGHHLVGRMEPDLLIRFGGPGPSRRIVDLVSGPVLQVVVTPTWSDPGRTAQLLVRSHPGAVASALREAVPAGSPGEWARWWVEADEAVRAVLTPELEGNVTEPAMAAAAGRSEADVVTVASSMPIRDVEAFAFTVPAIVANRGASGIDGLVSTALGASAGVSRPLALTGDISLLHDSNGFLLDPRPSCVFLVADNSGGGIFSFLPQAEHVGAPFERLFATPPGRDLALLAEFHHLGAEEVDSIPALEAAVRDAWKAGGSHLIVGRTDRRANVAEHARLNRLAAEAVASVAPPVG